MRLIAVILLGFCCWVTDVMAAQSLTTEDMLQAVRQEFAEQGIASNVELEFFGGKTSFELNDAEDAKILISGLDVNEDQNKFTADAEIFADGKSVDKTKLIGRYFVLVEAFLPVQDIAKGKIIGEGDLQKTAVRSNRLRQGFLTNKEDLVGKQAVKQLKAGKPVAVRDVSNEIIIKKGQDVTVVYVHKGLQITSKMEALEDGAEGQKIRMLNSKSQKEIVGRVLDKNTVEIVTE